MARMKSLKDISGETVYPKTVASAVMFDEQNTMSALASNGLYVAGETQDFEEIDPINADTLQGHDSDYFASKEDLNTRIDDVTASIKAEVTPELGVDYFTENDENRIASRVFDLIKNGGVVGFIDENNNIILKGNIPKNNNYSIKYEMDDDSTIDIGDLVFVNDTVYSITNNLTNCTNDNGETSVVNKGAYSATISANSGYEFSSVVVTMGGTDITSTAVRGDKTAMNVSITSVTGNIVITATATTNGSNSPSYTNLADPISSDWLSGSRFSSDGAVTSDTNAIITNYIPITAGAKYYIKGLKASTKLASGSIARSCIYTTEKNVYLAIHSTTTHANAFTVDEDVVIFDLTKLSTTIATGFIRFGGDLTGSASDVIITVNEPIS